jgi:ADP-ribose pyrophosphatase YjhB (NUDIX family)
MKFEVSAGGIVYKNLPRLGGEKSQLLWLIVRHSKNHHWGFPKGHIGDNEIGESMEHAALREVAEEGGIKAKIIAKVPDKIQYFFKMKGELIRKNLYYYLMEYESGDPKDHDHEISEAKFVTEKELLDILSFKTDKDAFLKARELHLNT